MNGAPAPDGFGVHLPAVLSDKVITGLLVPPDDHAVPYRIAPDEPAFGLRGAWMESYSGGGAYYTALYLFAVGGDRLRQVFAASMSAYRDIAGDWHKDETRDHDITVSANVLVVSPRSTNGHFDLVVKSRAGSWQRVFRWSSETGAYEP